MSVTKIVEIPASRRLTIDIPPEVPLGRTLLTFTPEAEDQKTTTGAWVNPLKGLCKGSKLTLERFRERQRKDLELEEELNRRLQSGNQ
jgi:hypothetical protein